MAELSDGDCINIRRWPLKPAIGYLQQALQTVVENNFSNPTEPQKIGAFFADDAKNTICNLIAALQVHQVARNFKLKDSDGTLAGDLATLFKDLDKNQISTSIFIPLIHSILQQASDIEIWKIILQLVAPQVSPSVTFGRAPASYSSASHGGSERVRSLLEDALRDEFWDCSYKLVPGFFEKYFEDKSWTQRSNEIYDAAKCSYKEGRWTLFPDPPVESEVWRWLSQFQDTYLVDTRATYSRTKDKSELTGTDTEAQLDLLVKARDKSISRIREWADVYVVGEHSASIDARKFLQLVRYARNVFSSQPRRRFLHGFIMCGTDMELHVFDRSGTYSAEPFDIHKEPQRFVKALAGYCLMSDEELGLDTFTESETDREFVTVTDTSGEDRRIEIELHPIARQAAIVCRGTSCFRATDHKNAIKFSWAPAAKWLTEPDLLRMALKREVKGVAQLVGYKRIASTADLRDSLNFSKKRRLTGRLQKSTASSSYTQLATSPPTNSNGSVGSKRKQADPNESLPAKNSRSDSQLLKLNHRHEAGGSFVTSQTSHVIRSVGEPFVDRVLSCLVISPAGRPLNTFTSVTELLMALRDAIKAHRSLFLDGKILHRDISENNIIITNPDENGGFSGMLIDMDLATNVDEDGQNTRTDAQRMTGTLKFMAIEIVMLALRDARRDLEHTYRHDLESFFYVFLSICTSHGWDERSRPKEDPLRSWYVNTFDTIARAKLGDMGLSGFEELVLPRFSPAFRCVKGLAAALRNLLFLQGPRLRIGTPAEPPPVLYKQMIDAFDETIESLESS